MKEMKRDELNDKFDEFLMTQQVISEINWGKRNTDWIWLTDWDRREIDWEHQQKIQPSWNRDTKQMFSTPKTHFKARDGHFVKNR